MTDEEKSRAISDGIYAWCCEHPISTQDAIEEGAKKAVESFLNNSTIIDRIIESVSKGVVNE